ncbi:MAG TPA: PhzF family phenazine biosynthesis protein [Rhodanobacteraceae bacterium]|nr:PhzF family phenazine biosynthesis protein [Rhodanobacteraceae bacterium]
MSVMQARRFRQVDVFAAEPYRGNAVAVVLDAEGLGTEAMLAFTRWTNLSEAAFILPPDDARADYRLRIFTAAGELPFAGHPTLGSAHAWLAAGGRPANEAVLVQECGAGLVEIRREGNRLAFAAPPLRRQGAVAEPLAGRVVGALRLDRQRVRAVQWVDNGPGWIGVLVDSAATVLALEVDRALMHGLAVGVIGPHDEGGPADFEVRGFFTGSDVFEDPVTGSLNASLAQWLMEEGLAPPRYRVRQGTVLGRNGLVELQREGDRIWVGGACIGCIEGTVRL